MAANSIREQIILADIAILDAMLEIKTTKRAMQGYEGLKRIAGTQFPIAAVVGGLPVPVEHASGRTGDTDLVEFSLSVDIYVYFHENEDMDQELSNMLDSLWAALYQDQKRGGLCTETTLSNQPQYSVWPPYVAFQITCKHKYYRNTGGI